MEATFVDEKFSYDHNHKYTLHIHIFGQWTYIRRLEDITQLTFACSKSTIKTLEKGVKYVQS